MPEDYLIVDGYNVINSWPELAALKNKDYAHARDKLVEILSDYQGLVKINIILVFDAHQVRNGIRRRERVNGIEIVYTREGETADMFIERLVGELPSGSVIGVATSDWAEQRIVFGKGAYRLSARELYIRVRHAQKIKDKYLLSGIIRPFSLDTQIGNRVRDTLEKWRRKK